MVVLIYIPINAVQEFPFLRILASIGYGCLFDNSNSYYGKVIPHCAFDLRFPDD
jgi:hypothetical protein